MSTSSRRAFLETTGTLATGMLLGARVTGCDARHSRGHPRIYVSRTREPGLRTVDDLRAAIQTGRARALYARIKARVTSELGTEAILPTTPFADRGAAAIRDGNRDFVVCNEAGQRMLCASIVTLLEEDDRHKATVLGQMEALFDEARWKAWIDDAHVRFGHPADLRTGMLARDVALAYDWLYPALTEDERSFIREGLDRMGIQPFLESVSQEPWWMKDLNNWLTTIVGGLGVAGMVLGSEHPDSERLVQIGLEEMDRYMGIYGLDGEFNESVAYANATNRPVAYYEASRYHTGGGENRLAKTPFPETCKWVMYLTMPPGRVAAFGDSHADAAPWTAHFAPVAAASRDGVIQWFYNRLADQQGANPLNLLWNDPTVKEVSPEGVLPRGRIFPAHGGCFVSRTDWEQESTACIVYGKVGREENHEHNDLGHVCIDGYGERLIVDLGSPPHYPVDFFEEQRWQYYNASIRGHNVLMFGGREMHVPIRRRGEPVGDKIRPITGRFVRSKFEDERGGYVVLDTTNAYQGARSVRRTVVHLVPGVAVVLDEASLHAEEEISLRWHMAMPAMPRSDGSFSFVSKRARLQGKIANLGAGTLRFVAGQHAYAAPYDRGRDGDLLEQRNEPYVEALLFEKACRLVTLFSVSSIDADDAPWTETDNGWSVATPAGTVTVRIVANRLVVMADDPEHAWNVDLARESVRG